jgi:hypothetical protein
MFFTFRLFLVAAGLVILALAVTARGLVPEPEVRTRIGEVPSVGFLADAAEIKRKTVST